MALTFEEVIRIDLVKNHVELALNWARERMLDKVAHNILLRTKRAEFDSPLEAVFDTWWLVMLATDRIHSGIERIPQHHVVACGNRYRLDFLLQPDYDRMVPLNAFGLMWPKVAVELDGHDYHERTKEQVTYRNARDRDLQSDGWLVLHYSGSELVADPVACVKDAHEKAHQATLVVERQMYEAKKLAANQTDMVQG